MEDVNSSVVNGYYLIRVKHWLHATFNLSYSICLCLEQSLLTLPPKQIFNGSKDMLRKHSNHTLINITRVRIHMNRCESNDDCKGGSYCFGYRCICPFDMIMKDGLCQRMFPISHKKGSFHFQQ